MFQGSMQETNPKDSKDLKDIDRTEFGLLLPACVLIVFIGLFPKPFIDRVSPAVDSLLTVEKTVNVHTGEKEHH
jgi:NADH-quinone oxidoreductase subunit M